MPPRWYVRIVTAMLMQALRDACGTNRSFVRRRELWQEPDYTYSPQEAREWLMYNGWYFAMQIGLPYRWYRQMVAVILNPAARARVGAILRASPGIMRCFREQERQEG